MYLSDRIIFLQMQKAGCSHIATLLQKHEGGNIVGKHQPLKERNKDDTRIISISCRNPWDWYVSLWAHGCMGRGKLRYHLTNNTVENLKLSIKQRQLNSAAKLAVKVLVNGGNQPVRSQFLALYSDANNEKNFRQWLSLILDASQKDFSLPDQYSTSTIHESVGMMTYRYLSLSTDFTKWESRGRHLASFDEAQRFMDSDNIIDKVIKLESVEEGVRDLLASVGIMVSVDELTAKKKTNRSYHKDYRYYYDEESVLNVQHREKLLVERFGYNF